MEPTVTISLDEYNSLKLQNEHLTGITESRMFYLTESQQGVLNEFYNIYSHKVTQVKGIGFKVVVAKDEVFELLESLERNWLREKVRYEKQVEELKHENRELNKKFKDITVMYYDAKNKKSIFQKIASFLLGKQ